MITSSPTVRVVEADVTAEHHTEQGSAGMMLPFLAVLLFDVILAALPVGDVVKLLMITGVNIVCLTILTAWWSVRE